MNRFYYDSKLKAKAQELRREMTVQEKRLWYGHLRQHQAQFRRQKQFGRYIVDFYCSSAKLVIELDGAQHDTVEGRIHDRNRTAYLESLGFAVLRFSNHEVDDQFEEVCARIDQCVEARSQTQPSPMGKVAARRADG